MNPLIQLKTIPLLLIALALVGFALLPGAQAVVPPPDGGYPNFTTAEGTNAFLHLTSGTANTGLGWSSLLNVTAGSFNTAVGAGTLALNTADSNTATGVAALLLNTIGTQNTANGTAALVNNSTGNFNSAFGAFALNRNVEATDNTAVGASALMSNTTGASNTGIGSVALFANTEGATNTATGASALSHNTTGDNNTADGTGSLFNNTTGNNNTAVGNSALDANNGSNNTALGINAGANVTTASNVTCIGANVEGANASNSCYIGQIFGATSSSGSAVFVNSSGKLGTTTSSRRFKEGIKPIHDASEALLSLKPVTFLYKKEIDPDGTSQFGLIAEDVEKVNPDLVVRDKVGKPYSVRYDQVNAMLLNEFLKEYRRNEKQEATIACLQKQIEALAAGLQRVSDHLELNKSAPQIAVKNQ